MVVSGPVDGDRGLGTNTDLKKMESWFTKRTGSTTIKKCPKPDELLKLVESMQERPEQLIIAYTGHANGGDFYLCACKTKKSRKKWKRGGPPEKKEKDECLLKLHQLLEHLRPGDIVITNGCGTERWAKDRRLRSSGVHLIYTRISVDRSSNPSEGGYFYNLLLHGKLPKTHFMHTDLEMVVDDQDFRLEAGEFVPL